MLPRGHGHQEVETEIIIRSNFVQCSNDQRVMMNSTLIKFVNKTTLGDDANTWKN